MDTGGFWKHLRPQNPHSLEAKENKKKSRTFAAKDNIYPNQCNIYVYVFADNFFY